METNYAGCASVPAGEKREVKAMIDRDRMISEFVELARIPSLSRREGAMAEALMQRLEALGISATTDATGEAIGGEVGNVIAHVPATAAELPCLMLNAHIDTVGPGEGIEPVVEDERIASSGETIVGADDKCGVVILLEVVRCIIEERIPHGGLDLVFTVAEEIGLHGAKHLDYSKLRARMAYVLDGGQEAGVITRAAPYANSIKFTVRGRAAHAGVCPEKGVNAIRVAAAGIAAMRLGRLDDETTANIGVIRGGEASNIVPEHCYIEGEARSHDEQKLRSQTDHMVKCMQAAAASAGAQVEIDLQRSYNGFCLGESDPVVALAVAAARSLGVEPKLRVGGGGSDANIFNEHGIPAVILATGAAEVHTTSEYVSIPTMIQCGQWLVQVLRELSATSVSK
jgi:tripeptide aminopeptidase